jgi:hypothetical protein
MEPEGHPVSINQIDEDLETIYIRIDTNDKYFITLVPSSYNALKFPPQILSIIVPNLTTHRCVDIIIDVWIL